MTNSDTTHDGNEKGTGRRRVRPWLKVTFATVVALLGVAVFASPAFAHSTTVVGSVSCGTNDYSITWTISNDYPEIETAVVTTVTGGLGTLSASTVTIAATGPTGSPLTTTTITQTLPATDSGTDGIDVTGTWPQPNPYTDSTSASISLPTGCWPAAGVTVSKSIVSPTPPVSLPAGSATDVVYGLTVANTSVALPTAGTVTVTDAVPTGTTYVAGSASCGTVPSCTATESGGMVSYSIGSGLAADTSYLVTFAVTVDSGDAAGTIPNTAQWSGPGCTPGAGSSTCATNTVTITVTTPVITVTDISVSKSDSAGSSSVDPGEVITYTLSADNLGNVPSSITVTDAAPAGTTLTTPAPACPAATATTCAVSTSGSTVTWAITNLPAGSSYALTFAVVVNAGATGTITNTGLYTGPGCTTAGGCSTNATHNPVTTTSPTPTTTTTTTTPVTTTPGDTTTATTTVLPSASPAKAISGATTVETGEPWAGSTPYVVAVFAAGLALLGCGELRRRRRSRVPTA